jgi:SAM-dependent methyltransferase
MTRLDAPATGRNRGPILEILTRWLGANGTDSKPPSLHVLEIASGTGQHAIGFAQALPHLRWQPSDLDADSLASIEAWRAEAGLPNVAAPIRLDVCDGDWPDGPFDVIFNANMIHIAPWTVAEALFAGAGRILADGGLLFLYGPFRVGGRHTAPSNDSFDADLRRRNPEWGVRDLERVVEQAASAGLLHVETNEMPANNKLLVFQRGSARPGSAQRGSMASRRETA